MRSLVLPWMAVLLALETAYGESTIHYTIETGGSNNAYEWQAKASPQPFFQSGVTDGSTTVIQGEDLTWAVRVTVSGAHSGTAGNGLETHGAANLVFDLQLFQADGSTPVDNFGAAPLACSSGTLGQVGAKDCKPTGMGFWSSINDGDTDNPNDANSQVLDTLANAAFAYGIYAAVPAAAPSVYPAPSGTTPYRLIDGAGSDIINTPAGPNFDYGWYPTSNGRGGIDTEGTKTISTSVTTVNSALVGFGAGYKVYDNTHRAGVGVASLAPYNDAGYGVDRPLFEGQINTSGLAAGTYVLKVVPCAYGNNILHGDVTWDAETPSYGGAGSFAAKANAVEGSTATFEVHGCPCGAAIAGRYVFYNQCFYDGNRIGIDAGPIAGPNNDDGDAIDPTLTPLMAGGGCSGFSNYTNYVKGLNGLVYEIANATREPQLSDFTFMYYGRTGTSAAVTKTATAIRVWYDSPAAGTDRVFLTFAKNDIHDGWLEVTIGTGFGLPTAERHWWGNCVGDTKNNPNNMIVNALDLSAIKAHYTIPNTAPVWSIWDVDKNGTVNALDISICKSKYSVPPTTAVQPICK